MSPCHRSLRSCRRWHRRKGLILSAGWLVPVCVGERIGVPHSARQSVPVRRNPSLRGRTTFRFCTPGGVTYGGWHQVVEMGRGGLEVHVRPRGQNRGGVSCALDPPAEPTAGTRRSTEHRIYVANVLHGRAPPPGTGVDEWVGVHKRPREPKRIGYGTAQRPAARHGVSEKWTATPAGSGCAARAHGAGSGPRP